MRTSTKLLIAAAMAACLASACGGAGSSGRQSLPEPANPYYSSLTAIWAFSDQDVWAVGSRVLHFDGQQWSEVAGPGNGIILGALWGLAPDDLWATSGSKIFRWRGAANGWVEFEHGIPNPPEFSAIWVLAPDDFAVGGGVVNWEIVRVKGGAVTRAFTYGAASGIWGAGTDDVWAVAESGGFWHWSGGRWSNVKPASGGDRPQSIWGFGGSDIWAAGEQDALVHWDGTSWTPITVNADQHAELRAVWGAAQNDVWAAGEAGAIWHFDGTSWSDSSTDPGVFLTSIRGSGPRSVWAVGYELSMSGNHGVVYRLQ